MDRRSPHPLDKPLAALVQLSDGGRFVASLLPAAAAITLVAVLRSAAIITLLPSALCLLLLAAAHRYVAIRLVPSSAPPPRAAPRDRAGPPRSTATLPRTNFFIRLLPSLLTLPATILLVDAFLAAPSTSCTAAAAASAEWAAFFAVCTTVPLAFHTEVEQLVAESLSLHRLGHFATFPPHQHRLAWPLLQQSAWLRLRPLLRPQLARSLVAAVALLAAFGIARAAVPLRLAAAAAAATHLSPSGAFGCGGATAAAPSSTAEWASTLPSLLAAAAFAHAATRLGRHFLHISYTQRLAFVPAPPAPSGALVVDDGGALLIHALKRDASPLTQHLAFLDLTDVADSDARRRRALFDAGAERWAAVVAAALRPIDALTAALEAARAAASRRPPRKPVGWLVQLGAKLTSYEPIFGAADGAMWERLVGPSQLVAWAAQAVSSLLLASYHEDTLGSAHLAGSLDAVLSALLRLLAALDSLDAYTAPQKGGGGGGALAARASVSSRARADGLARAAALEGVARRCVAMLLQAYGHRARGAPPPALAASLPDGARAQLERALRE